MNTTNSSYSLTKRDLKVISMVYEYQGCAIEHVRLRWFPGPAARSMPCYRRIAHLVEQGFLTSNRLPSQSGKGSGKLFLTLGPNGRPVIAKFLGVSVNELARSRISSSWFTGHHLCVSDIRLAIELGAQNSPVFTLADWTSERDLHHSPLRVRDPKTSKDIVLIPDATFSLLSLPDAASQTFFVEADMGTIPKRMKIKLRGYLLRPDNPAPVLFVVPNQTRQAVIASWALEAAREVPANPTIFWLTTRDRVTQHTVLSSAIWQVVGSPDSLAIGSLAVENIQSIPEDVFEVQTLHGGLGL